MLALVLCASLNRTLSSRKPKLDHNLGVYYWGQNSGRSQKRLREYCDSEAADIFVLAFLYQFGSGPTHGAYQEFAVDFANNCPPETFPGTRQLFHCAEIAEDIKYCQAKDKQIFISLGGATATYDVYTEKEAIQLAQDLHNIFGTGTSNTRPFDDVVVDGVDLDIEWGTPTYYPTVVDELRRLEPDILISAAPQCVWPDAWIGEALDKSWFDYVWVQWYNNPPCAPGAGADFNFPVWNNWAEKTSINKDVRIFLGLPGGQSGAGTGYLGWNNLEDAIKRCTPKDHFGGVMMWDASQAWSNTQGGQNYAEYAKSLL